MKFTKTERAGLRPKRDDARHEILKAANAGRRFPLRMRHIQQAVCIVRQRQLVKPKVLEAAGYNAHSNRR
jgi:hypothetical protein